MKNKVTVEIAGESYTMLVDEDDSAEYMQRIATLVDKKITEARAPGLSIVQTAILAACNIADDYFKASEASDNLRHQMKSYLEESASLRGELSDAQRELARLKGQK